MCWYVLRIRAGLCRGFLVLSKNVFYKIIIFFLVHKVPLDVNAEHKPFLSLSIGLMDKYASKLTDFLIVDCIIFVSFWFY